MALPELVWPAPARRVVRAARPCAAEGVALLVLALLFAMADHPPVDVRQFREAAHHWPDPYALPVEQRGAALYRIFTPFAAILVLPLGLLPPSAAMIALRAVSVLAIHLLAGRSLWRTALVLTSPGAFLVLRGNLDALSALGVFLPGAGALLLLAVKPQAAGLAALLILRRDGWRQAVAPALLLLATIWLWPTWIPRALQATQDSGNLSLFPWSLFVAGWLYAEAWRQRDPVLAAIATPLASPYVALGTVGAWLALLVRRFPRAACLVWLALWVYPLWALLR